MIRRRELIAGLGSAAAWPLVALGQQPTIPVIGFLMPQSADDDYKTVTVPFLQGLKETGYVEGQNVAIEYRWAENQYDRLPAIYAWPEYVELGGLMAYAADLREIYRHAARINQVLKVPNRRIFLSTRRRSTI